MTALSARELAAIEAAKAFLRTPQESIDPSDARIGSAIVASLKIDHATPDELATEANLGAGYALGFLAASAARDAEWNAAVRACAEAVNDAPRDDNFMIGPTDTFLRILALSRPTPASPETESPR